MTERGAGAPAPVYRSPHGEGWSFADFQSEPLLFFLEPYRSLGPVFRVDFDGAETFVLAGPEANDFFMRERGLWSYHEAFAFIASVITQDLITMDGAQHSAKRQRMLPSFRLDVLDRQAGVMRAALIELLEEIEGRNADLRDLMNLAFFRQSSRAMGMELEDEVFEQVLEAEKFLLEGTAHEGPESDLGKRFLAAFGRAKGRIRPHVEELLRRNGQDDMLTPMARGHSATMSPLGHEELIEDVAVLLEAGVENGAHIILWALLLLSKHPAWEKTLRDELAGLPPDAELTATAAPLLHATIYEAERLRPPFPILPRVPVRDFELAGVAVPERAPVIHALTLVHFLEEIYEAPLEFRPERHIGSRQLAKLHAAFGMGTHRCIGMPQARHQAAVTLRELVTNWDIAYGFDPSLHYSMTSAVTPIEDRLPVTVTRKERNS